MKKRNKVVREGVGVRFPISPSLFALIESTILAFILEILSRRSFVSAVEFVFQKPHVFLFNVIIVALSLVLALLFRKKVFALTLVTTIWLGFGIANCVLLSFRTASPLTSVDLQLGLEAIQMVNIYFEWWQLVLIVIGVVFAIALLLIVAIRSPKFRKEGQHAYLRLTSCLVVFLLALFTLTNIGHVSTNLRPSLYDAYLEYGFPYCFSYSFFDIGINKPKYYSGREVQYISDEIDIEVEIDHEVDEVTTFFDEIIETVEIGAFKEKPPEYTVDAIEAIRDTLAKKAAEKERSAEDYPNIIFVQLESFFDPMTIKHLTFSEDPIPVFRSLKDGNTSGKLNVPTVAGGTANTEFEVLTGCCLDFFGAGEFPYYSILREKAVESLATDLRINGYTATGIHNYTGSFYYRNDVYQNLGFNNFVSIEYMDGYEKTLTQWPKDEILKDVMKDAIRLTEGKDFIYTITVQTHGKYIEIPEEMAPVITVEGARSEEEKNVMEFYLAMLTEVDKLIGDIIREYEDFEEDTIIVFFGDHLPGLDLTNDDLTTGDIYETEYVIWANYELPENDRDIEAYQLGAHVLEHAEIDTGVMIRFHQLRMEKENYLRNLEILEYDMLYGNRYVYGGKELKDKNQLKMGLYPITIADAYVKNGNLFVKGENFTSFSEVFIDGERYNSTIFIDRNMLVVPDLAPDDGMALVVKQLSSEGYELSETEAYICMGLNPIVYEH